MSPVQNTRWGPCPHCGAEGWSSPGLPVHPRFDHDRPDGRRCRAAARDKIPALRRGYLYRRRCDGFIFRAELVSRKVPGAFLQCTQAERISGWFNADHIARDFERIPELGEATQEK